MDISIVIPNYNRKDSLKQCLESLFKQDYPRTNFEIIVVDDGSSDRTEEMLKELSKEHPNLRYLLQLHKGPAAARNLGIKDARARIIGFTDSDCILKSNWVRKMLEAHQLTDGAIAIGGKTLINPHNIKAQVSQFLSDGAVKTTVNGKSEIIFFPTCNVTIKKNYLNGEGFNELFPLPAGEDLEFFWRIYKKGNRFIYKQDIEIFHNCHSSFKSFLKQAYMYGRGNYLVQYIHKDHPLLKEIKTQKNLFFILGLLINFIKIPRFSYLLGKRLIQSQKHFCLYEKFQIYLYFALHKILYLMGNIMEHRRIFKLTKDALQRKPKEIEKIPDRPEFIILDITHRCNLKCNICEIRKDRPIEEFTTDEIKDLIVQTIEWGVKEFVLSGGEPFVRKDIFEILDFVKEKKYHIGILTNGILLNEEFIKRLSPYLISGVLSLSISLDALTPEIHDDIRGARGCFERTFAGLKIISELKKKYSDINFNVISIILNENLEELLPLANLLKSLNVNSIQFQPLLANNLIMKQRSNKVNYWITEERLNILDKIVDDLIDFKRANPNLVINSDNNLRLVKKYFRNVLTGDDVRCFYAIKTLLIANNGDVTTCFGSYGNIRKTKLRQIWNSKEIEYAREKTGDCKHPCLLPCFTEPPDQQKWTFRITRLQIESTNRCNLRCSICWHTLGNIRDFGEIPFVDFKRIIDQFDYLEGINLQGLGEPFLTKDIFLMIEYSRKKGIAVWLASNVTLLNENICEKIIKSGLSLLRISIDARNPKVYSKIKVGSDISIVMQNIKTLNKLKKEFKSETPKLAINTVVLKSNIDELINIVELANELEIDEISLIPLVVFNKGLATKEESMFSNRELFLQKISAAKRLAEKYNITFESGVSMERHPESEDLPQKDVPQCLNGSYINYRGELSPCCNISYAFGNIIQKSLNDLWDSKKYERFREYILNNKPTCLKCNFDIEHLKILDK